MIDLIEGKVAPLAAHPNIGRTGRKRGTYELVAHESYVVIYRKPTKENRNSARQAYGAKVANAGIA